MKKITRADAKKKGLKRFYTGNVGKCGHDGERYVSNGNCVICTSGGNRKKKAAKVKTVETVPTVITVEDCKPTMEHAVEIVENRETSVLTVETVDNVKPLFPNGWIVRERSTRKEWGVFVTRKEAQQAYRDLREHLGGTYIVMKK